MCFFVSFFPATIWTIIGYFVLFSSTKAEGRIRSFGQVLAIWVFVLAGCILFAGAYVTFSGLCSIDAVFECLK
jgi:zinc transporter ZupT